MLIVKTEKNTEAVSQSRRDVVLEMNTEETYRYMSTSRHQIAGHTHNVLISDKFFENMTKTKYLGKTVTNNN
jgi:hypothetical protein